MGYEEIVEDRSGGGRDKNFNKWAFMAAMFSSKQLPVDDCILRPRTTVLKSGLIKRVPSGKRTLEQRGEEKKKIKRRLADIGTGVGSRPQTSGLFPSGSLDSKTNRRSTRLDIDEGEV
ncbi:hypothetical protein MKW98_023142 [Papaver atlanticum]|uniref:Uncharacterized protein n=1 Tax=Papaver atlanticum TaxID=357466 RepID=A0AAD4TB37_9MAGN|nr:hypothetical protein MKW98_023142 [Papaver atlanticum]